VRRLAPLGAALVAALLLATVAAADARDPRVKTTKADQARAVASLLRPTDLGPAWTGNAEKPNGIKIPTCPAYAPNDHDLTITGHAEAVASLPSSGLQVDTDVEVFKTAKQVEVLFKRMLQPKLATCLKYDLEKSIGGSNVSIGGVARVAVAKAGSHASLFRVALKVKNGKSLVDVDSDFMFISQQRTQFFVNVVFPASLASQLVSLENTIARTLARRAAQA
jgi:hypothetical protein